MITFVEPTYLVATHAVPFGVLPPITTFIVSTSGETSIGGVPNLVATTTTALDSMSMGEVIGKGFVVAAALMNQNRPNS